MRRNSTIKKQRERQQQGRLIQSLPGLSGYLMEGQKVTEIQDGKPIRTFDIDNATDFLHSLPRGTAIVMDEDRPTWVCKNAKLSTAVHESGHAVVAELLGFPVLRVEIGIKHRQNLTGSHLTCGQTQYVDRHVQIADSLNLCAVYCGGAVAQELFLDSSARQVGAGCEHDHAAIARLVKQVQTATGVSIPIQQFTEEGIKSGTAKARELLPPAKGAVLKIADLLIAKNEITGDEVRQVVSAHTAEATCGIPVSEVVQ